MMVLRLLLLMLASRVRPSIGIRISNSVDHGLRVPALRNHVRDVTLMLRGGAEAKGKSKGRSNAKKKKKRSSAPDSSVTKKIKKSKSNMKRDKATEPGEDDAERDLGNAIRNRRSELRKEDLLQSIDVSVSSLGYALGASDRLASEGGGVEVESASVLANYFLKSHGGVHWVQCTCSLLAASSAMGTILLKTRLRHTLLRRAMIFAVFKHATGLFAAASLAAKAVSTIGLGQSRLWIDQLVRDPVSQYAFYAALMLLWLPPRRDLTSVWLLDRYTSAWGAIVGPVLVRELVSIAIVASDMLVLSNIGSSVPGVGVLLRVCKLVVDSVMSLIVSPKSWKQGTPAQRQAILAKIVSQISLAMEIVVGVIMIGDFLRGFGQLTFSNSPKSPSLKEATIQFICTRLYLHFLWVRRRKVTRLAVGIHHGASQLPLWILNVLLRPLDSMGIAPPNFKWMEYSTAALGLDQV